MKLVLIIFYYSSCGHLYRVNGHEPAAGELRARFALSDSTLSPSQLSLMMNDFVSAAETGTHAEQGWPSNTYVVSKVGLSALSRIQQGEFDSDSRQVEQQINGQTSHTFIQILYCLNVMNIPFHKLHNTVQ